MRTQPIQHSQGERGNILVVTLLILFVVSVIGSTLVSVSSMDLKISGNQRSTVRSLSVAEAGVNEAIHRLALPNPTPATVGSWTGNIAISDSEPYDPEWQTRVYLASPGSVPLGAGSVVNTGTLQDPNQDYLRYSRSSGTDDVLTVRHKWRDRDGDGNRDDDEIVRYDAEVVPPENFTSGFPVEVVTAAGRVGKALRSIEVELTKRTLLARTLGAIYTDKAIQINGNPAICGHNHDVSVPTGTKPNSCFAWHLGTGHLPGITTTGGEVDISGAAADVVGDPAPTDTSSTNPFFTLAEVLGISVSELNQILANADHTSITNPLDGITYINGDVNINSNTVGTGLIYVTGDLRANGSLNYRGLIYVEGDLDLTGTPWILGSVIVKGTSDYNFSAGNAGILYSKDAIKTYVGQSMPVMILSWREL
jgi:hypothetical protein